MRIRSVIIALLACLTMQAQDINGTWKGKLSVGPQTLTLVLHVDKAQQKVTLDIPEQAAEALPLTVKALTADSLNATFDQAGFAIEGKLKDGKISGSFAQGAFGTPITFEPGAVTYNRPQEPRAPYPYTTREVKFTNHKAGATLAGTLSLPVGYKAGQKVPVALMVTGSGPENRDEEVFHHKPFLVIADYLARHGVATLRYDDRGMGESTGPADSTITTADLAEDAAAGVEYLRSQGLFSKVGLIGHSEGGGIGYMLASQGKLDFLVSLAGPAGKMDQILMLQLNGLAHAQGMKTDIIHSVEEARTQFIQMTGDTPATRYMLDWDLTPYVRKTTCPVMAVNGEKDLNVPAVSTMTTLMLNLPKNPKNLMKVYPGLSHSFQPSATGNPLDAINIETTFSEDVLKDMAAWIQGL